MKKQVKTIAFEIKDINEEERSFLAVASTEDIDRDNDRIIMDGWDLSNFKKNPVVPWAHRYGEPPVARAEEIFVQDGKLMFRPKFATKGEYDFADTIYKLYRGGFLRSFSVGFMPKRYEIVERKKGARGYDYLECELWEISACTVPSNPNALVAAKAKGVIDDDELGALEEKTVSVSVDREGKEADTDTNHGHDDLVPAAIVDLSMDKKGDKDGFKVHVSTVKKAEDRRLKAEEEDKLAGLIRQLNDIANKVEALCAQSGAHSGDNPEKAEGEDMEHGHTEPKTLSLDNDQVAEIVEECTGILEQKLAQIVRKRFNYYLGIVD